MSDATAREWRFYIDDMIAFGDKVVSYTSGFDQDRFVASGLTYDATLHGDTRMNRCTLTMNAAHNTLMHVTAGHARSCLRALATSLLCLSCAAFGADGLVTLKSPHSAKDTMNRFEDIAKQRGLNVFVRIDHAAGAARVGKSLRPTEVLIFGNPQGGTPLMECAQTVGIDLPLKALVWEDADGQVWFAYNDLPYLAQRHGIVACPGLANIGKALAGLAEASVAR